MGRLSPQFNSYLIFTHFRYGRQGDVSRISIFIVTVRLVVPIVALLELPLDTTSSLVVELYAALIRGVEVWSSLR